jgi:hypothetical protein
MENKTDCLVLCIDDFKTVKIFVIYDYKENKFIIRGKNYDDNTVCNSDSDSDSESESCSNNSNSYLLNKPFSFQCKLKKNILSFIDYIVSINRCEFTLYNFDNLSYNSNNIHFKFLEDSQEENNSIVSYDRDHFDETMCLNMLNILKNIYNEY